MKKDFALSPCTLYPTLKISKRGSSSLSLIRKMCRILKIRIVLTQYAIYAIIEVQYNSRKKNGIQTVNAQNFIVAEMFSHSCECFVRILFEHN